MEQIKTLEERENSLILNGKEKGFITYEELETLINSIILDIKDYTNKEILNKK